MTSPFNIYASIFTSYKGLYYEFPLIALMWVRLFNLIGFLFRQEDVGRTVNRVGSNLMLFVTMRGMIGGKAVRPPCTMSCACAVACPHLLISWTASTEKKPNFECFSQFHVLSWELPFLSSYENHVFLETFLSEIKDNVFYMLKIVHGFHCFFPDSQNEVWANFFTGLLFSVHCLITQNMTTLKLYQSWIMLVI